MLDNACSAIDNGTGAFPVEGEVNTGDGGTIVAVLSRILCYLVKPGLRLLYLALIVSVAGSEALAQAAPLTTVRNSVLSVPAAKLLGSNAMVSSVMPGTLHGGHAALVSAPEWVRQYSGGSFNSRNRGQALAVRPDGSIVVTGYSSAPSTDYDFVTLAYTPDGTPLWTNRYDGPEHGYDSPFLVATAPSGDVWVAGQSILDQTTSSIGDAVLLRYASNGLPLWTNLYTGFDTNNVSATALAVDGSGNAYLRTSASYFPPVGSGWPVEDALIKYDLAGNVAWNWHYFVSAPDSGDAPHDVEAVALDGAGNPSQPTSQLATPFSSWIQPSPLSRSVSTAPASHNSAAFRSASNQRRIDSFPREGIRC